MLFVCARKQDGDLWCKSTSALEMNQAELGRTIDKVSSRRIGASETVRMAEVEGQYVKRTYTTYKGMAYTAARHFIASANFKRDADTLKSRDVVSLVLGPDSRVTQKRITPKFALMPVDEKQTAVQAFVLLMRAGIQPQDVTADTALVDATYFHTHRHGRDCDDK